MDNPTLFFRRRRAKDSSATSVAVIGLGRFGGALATELVRSGTEVLGIDTDEDVVQSLNGVLTHVVRADSTKEVALEQLGVTQFDRVVVGIGSDIQASILTTSLLKRMGVRSIWAKAISEQHGLILEQLGIEHVIFPEADMGRRVAHLVRGAMLDYVEFDRDLVVAKTVAPGAIVGKTLEQAAVRRRYGVTIVKVRSADGEWRDADASSVISAGDLLIVIGPVEATERFAALR
ncbi:potassium channel family protein [Microbacterium lacticum]|uniref:potassium channel family protein n=1 Tax=Microbacterium lacticum TaxID=33885 RepID=UPI0018B08A5B|nr:TrkA family potassium uptake protein [Microbacterium lacticum]MBF9336363.1 TrkA family potassium uptake protein [Microbacterium lacticum]